MTTPGNLICSKCGYSNVPGDQFCGSCGTFLEYSGVVPIEPGPALDPGPFPGPATDPGPIPGPPRGAPTTTPVTPGQGPTGALIRCPNCGIANPPDRTFCQSCGSKLADAGRVVGATPEQIAAAVNQGPVVKVRTAHDPEEEADSGGRTKALIALCVVGVLLGVGVIVGYSLVRGGAATEASPNPSVAVVPSGGSVPPPSGSASSEPTDSTPPMASTSLTLNDAEASSFARNFPPRNVKDGDTTTAWKEGAKQAEGQSIAVSFDPATITAILVSNGYSATTDAFRRNPRLRQVDISVNGGAPIRVMLKDTANEQRIALDPPIAGATSVQLTIVSQYPGHQAESGGATQSAALGEIVVMGVTTP